jgi:hypothetical protein
LAVTVATVLGLVPGARAETYDLGFVQVGTNGSNAHGLVAVSDSGTASSDACNYSLGYPFGCALGSGVVVSGTGNASGAIAVSGTGNASTIVAMGYGTPVVAVSGTGCANAWDPYGADRIAVSGAGCATGTTDPFWEGYATSVAGGDATGNLAVSGLGNAHSRGESRSWTPGLGTELPGVAVAPVGNASGRGTVAVAGGSATTSGGLATVSVTGNGGGGSLANVCPLGDCR